jgi:predicted ribosomally synthesized peptide with SipW-like signal peptide
MPDKIELTRRRVLAGLGTVGVASAGAGLGTSAYFSDTESFTDNSLTAGELNLVVDWWTDVDQGMAGSSVNSGTVDGNPSEYTYEVTDVKPGDTGTLAFCPKIIDNPAWLWFGSDSGVTDYENGLTEPEGEVDSSGGDPGGGNGELSEHVQVDVYYASDVTMGDEQITCDHIRQMNNPDDYTLADLAADMQNGFLIDGDVGDGAAAGTQAYPASPDVESQTGPCICIEWEVPTSVGNIIQSDSVEFDFSLVAMQERNNPGGSAENPFNTTS